MKVLIPVTITDSMITSSTIAEPSSSEVVWASGTFALGDKRIVVAKHREYQCLTPGSRTISPELDPVNWSDFGPTDKFAAFDDQVSTPSETVTTMTFVIRPGFFNAIAMYGLIGSTVTTTVKDAPGGVVVYTNSTDLQEPPADWYEWLFSPIKVLTKLILTAIEPYTDPEITLTVTAPVGQRVAAGMIAIGDMRALIGESDWGGTQYGATVEPVTYSYIETDKYGTTRIVKRHSATDMNVRVAMPQEAADGSLATVQEALDIPCCWIASEVAGYTGLNVFGLGSGSLSYNSYGDAIMSIKVKGMI